MGNQMMIEIEKICLFETSTIREVIQNLNTNSARIVFILDDDERFVGIVVDGDIRRGLIKGIGLNDPVSQVVNRNPKTVTPGISFAEAVAIMKNLSVLHLPIIDKNGKLCGVHTGDKEPSRKSRDNYFVIMAGGYGKRMGHLTKLIPKPMLEVAGKPILEHLILRARDHGFTKIVITVHYLSDVIECYFGDGKDFGVDISYLREETPLGTAGALSVLKSVFNSPFLVSNADLISNVDFAGLLDFHINNQSDATIATRSVQMGNPFGVVEVDEGKVTSIIEKPIISSIVSAGIYAFSQNALEVMLGTDYCDMPDLLIRLINKNYSVHEFRLYENLHDIGRLSDWEEAQKAVQ